MTLGAWAQRSTEAGRQAGCNRVSARWSSQGHRRLAAVAKVQPSGSADVTTEARWRLGSRRLVAASRNESASVTRLDGGRRGRGAHRGVRAVATGGPGYRGARGWAGRDGRSLRGADRARTRQGRLPPAGGPGAHCSSIARDRRRPRGHAAGDGGAPAHRRRLEASTRGRPSGELGVSDERRPHPERPRDRQRDLEPAQGVDRHRCVEDRQHEVDGSGDAEG